jgi:hypothetical protein
MIAPSAPMISSFSIPLYRQMFRKLRFPMTDDRESLGVPEFPE